MRGECEALEGMRDRGRRQQGSGKPMKRKVGGGRGLGQYSKERNDKVFCFFFISGECDVRRLLCRGRLFGRLRQYLDVCKA